MKYKILVIIIVTVLAVGIIGSALVMFMPAKSAVHVLSDGKEIYSADLSTAEDTTFDVMYDGHINTVEIKDHQIRVLSADCPDQTCVHMGWLKSSATPVVCLPHKLIIEYTGASDDVDAVTG